MSTPSLSRVTLQSLDNYRTAATQAVGAYRAGGHRLVGAVNGTLKNSIYPRTAKLAPRTTHRIDGVRGSISDIVEKGIDQVADQADKAIAFSATTAAAQVHKAAKLAAGIDNPVVANGLHAAARLTMPGAQAALVVSTQVVKGANALAGIAGAKPAKRAVRKAAAGAKRKVAAAPAPKAKAVVKSAQKRVARVAKAVKAPVVQAKKAVVRRAKKVEKAVEVAVAA